MQQQVVNKIVAALKRSWPDGYLAGHNFGEAACKGLVRRWFTMERMRDDENHRVVMTHESWPTVSGCFMGPVRRHLYSAIQNASPAEISQAGGKTEYLASLQYAVDVTDVARMKRKEASRTSGARGRENESDSGNDVQPKRVALAAKNANAGPVRRSTRRSNTKEARQ